MAWPLRLKLFIIYVWVVHLRNIADKKLPSLQLLSHQHINQPSCVLTTSIFLSFLCQAGPDSPNWRELLALLQTVCQLQCWVHGGKWVCAWLVGWAVVSWWTLSFDQHFEIHILRIEASCSLWNAISQRHTCLTNHTLLARATHPCCGDSLHVLLICTYNLMSVHLSKLIS